MNRKNVYAALGPVDYSSEDMCECGSVGSLVLQDCLIPNPLYCGKCLGEVPPEFIPLAGHLVTRITQWRNLYRSLYLLWLHSGDYAAWAAERLLETDGQVNIMGRGIAEELTAGGNTCFYRWFVPCPETSPADCPLCGYTLQQWPSRPDKGCFSCRIVL